MGGGVAHAVLRAGERAAMDECGRGGGHAVDRTAVRVESDRARALRVDAFLDTADDDTDARVGERPVEEARTGETRAAAQLPLRGLADDVTRGLVELRATRLDVHRVLERDRLEEARRRRRTGPRDEAIEIRRDLGLRPDPDARNLERGRRGGRLENALRPQ